MHEIKLHYGLVEVKGEEEIQLVFKGTGKTAKAVSQYLLTASELKARPMVNWGRELAECSRDFAQEVKVEKQLSLGEFKDHLLLMRELDRGARHSVMRKIVKGIKAHPEYLAEFMDWVHSVLDDRKMAALALGMLGSLKTDDSRRELQEIYDGVTENREYLRHQVRNVVILNSDD